MPARKPTLTKLNEGDAARRGRHVLEAKLAAEPKVQSGLPQCPDRLKGDARLIYEHFRQQLELSGLNKACDAFALERAAKNLELIWRCDRAIDRGSPIRRVPIYSGRGAARKRVGYRQMKCKWIALRSEAERQFRAFASPFGLVGPASRSALTVECSPLEANKKLWEVLNQPRPQRARESISDPKPS